jgi:hypothetical protein
MGPGSAQVYRRHRPWPGEEPFDYQPVGRCVETDARLPSALTGVGVGPAQVTGGDEVSELLMKGLASTKRELEAGVADAEAELARTEEYCRKLEEMIAVGKATLHAASQMTLPKLQKPELGGNGITAVPDSDTLVKEGRK